MYMYVYVYVYVVCICVCMCGMYVWYVYVYVYVYACVVCLQLALTIPRLQFNEQLYSCIKSTFFSRVSHLLESTYTLLIRITKLS